MRCLEINFLHLFTVDDFIELLNFNLAELGVSARKDQFVRSLSFNFYISKTKWTEEKYPLQLWKKPLINFNIVLIKNSKFFGYIEWLRCKIAHSPITFNRRGFVGSCFLQLYLSCQCSFGAFSLCFVSHFISMEWNWFWSNSKGMSYMVNGTQCPRHS